VQANNNDGPTVKAELGLQPAQRTASTRAAGSNITAESAAAPVIDWCDRTHIIQFTLSTKPKSLQQHGRGRGSTTRSAGRCPGPARQARQARRREEFLGDRGACHIGPTWPVGSGDQLFPIWAGTRPFAPDSVARPDLRLWVLFDQLDKSISALRAQIATWLAHRGAPGDEGGHGRPGLGHPSASGQEEGFKKAAAVAR
jgi:hypothetical protein